MALNKEVITAYLFPCRGPTLLYYYISGRARYQQGCLDHVLFTSRYRSIGEYDTIPTLRHLRLSGKDIIPLHTAGVKCVEQKGADIDGYCKMQHTTLHSLDYTLLMAMSLKTYCEKQ